MNIHQPQEDPNIPGKEKKQLEDARNAITLNLAENTRLAGLITSKKYEVNELNKEEVAVTEKIELSKTDLKEKKQELEETNALVSTSKQTLKDVEASSQKITDKQDEKEQELNDREKAIVEKEEEIVNRDENSKTVQKQTEKESEELATKKKILEKALSEI